MVAPDLSAVLDGPARTDPDRVALVVDEGAGPGTEISYGELAARAAAWAGTLVAAGVGPGDRVALADHGGVRSTAVTVAAMTLGASTAQMNPALTADELATLVRVSEACPVGVGAAGSADTVRSGLGTVHGDRARVIDEAVDGTPPPPARDLDPDRAALVLFTSGTTGTPRPVPITAAQLVARMASYRAPFDPARAPTVSIMCVPSFHIGGMLSLLLNLYGGDTTVVMPRFDAGRWLELVELHRPVGGFLVPTMLSRIVEHPDATTRDLSSLGLLAYGAAAAPVELDRAAMERWPHIGFVNNFGQTETLGSYTVLLPEDHRDPRRVGSVGTPLPGVEVRVVDPVTGADVADGEVGELLVRSDQIVVERSDGWFATGDLAHRDPDGYLFPHGRIAETVNRGGEKFGPAEVADAVRSHPAVAECAVAGVPDAEMGERVGVVVVPADGATPPTLEELRAHCRRVLAPFKLPERLVVVDELPTNELGKLPRRAVVALFGSDADPPPDTPRPGT